MKTTHLVAASRRSFFFFKFFIFLFLRMISVVRETFPTLNRLKMGSSRLFRDRSWRMDENARDSQRRFQIASNRGGSLAGNGWKWGGVEPPRSMFHRDSFQRNKRTQRGPTTRNQLGFRMLPHCTNQPLIIVLCWHCYILIIASSGHCRLINQTKPILT